MEDFIPIELLAEIKDKKSNHDKDDV